MADTRISALTDGATAAATDRIPVARSPFATGDNRYVTPAYVLTYALGQANTWTAQQTWVAGTTSIAPFVFQSGTNLTTAAAGAAEFDGKCFYLTAAASSRQVNDCEQFVSVQGSPVALTNNSSSAQNVFAAANDVLTLAATTTYFFEAMYFINTGTTTHTTATEFTASSAFTNILYFAEIWSTTAGTISTTAPSVLDVAVSTATVLNATSTAPRTTIRCRGMIRTNGASTVTPKITFSAGPTGTCEVAVNSYFRVWPVGSNTVAAVGNWA